jgi:hypothetical protein
MTTGTSEGEWNITDTSVSNHSFQPSFPTDKLPETSFNLISLYPALVVSKAVERNDLLSNFLENKLSL